MTAVFVFVTCLVLVPVVVGIVVVGGELLFLCVDWLLSWVEEY